MNSPRRPLFSEIQGSNQLVIQFEKKTWPPKKNSKSVFFFLNTHLKEITS